MFRTARIVLVALIAALTLSGAQRVHGQDLTQTVAELHSATYSGGQLLPFEGMDYQKLADILPKALELSRKAPTLWQRIPSKARRGADSVDLYGALDQALGFAAVLAPTREAKGRWLNERLALAMRMLRDPQTARVYAMKRDTESDGSDYAALSNFLNLFFPGPRLLLAKDGFLRPDDWGLHFELQWTNQPGVVIVSGGVPLVAQDALQAVGVPVQDTGAGLQITNGKVRATIPIARQATERTGFRDVRGRAYIPAMELHRQGLFRVEVIREGQMVRLFPHPPHRD